MVRNVSLVPRASLHGPTRQTAQCVDFPRLRTSVRCIHEEIRAAVVKACERSSGEEMLQVVEDGEGDTIFAVDRVSEAVLVDLFERRIASR